MFNVTLNKKTFVLNEKTRILDLIPKEKQKNYCVDKVNNRL